MLAKLNTLAILAAASATFSVAAVAAPVVVDVRVAPPPPRYEVVPASRPGSVWVPGYWDWRGHRHVWVTGHWERARYGYSHRRFRSGRTKATDGCCGAAGGSAATVTTTACRTDTTGTATGTAFPTCTTRIPTTRVVPDASDLRPASEA